MASAKVAGAGGFISKMAHSSGWQVGPSCFLGTQLGLSAGGFDSPPSELLGLPHSMEARFQEAGSRS